MADEQGLDQDRLVWMFTQIPMEEHVLPDEDKIVEAVRQVLSTTLVT